MVVPWFPLTLYKMVKSKLPREGLHVYFVPSAHLLPCHLMCMGNMKLSFLSWARTRRKLPHCSDWESLRLSEILLVFTGVWKEDEKNFTLGGWLLQIPRLCNCLGKPLAFAQVGWAFSVGIQEQGAFHHSTSIFKILLIYGLCHSLSSGLKRVWSYFQQVPKKV